MLQTGDIITELGALSYVGIWVVALLSNIVIPVPEEVVLLALGYLAGTGTLDVFLVIPIVISGLLVSDIVVYSLSKRGSRMITFVYQKFFAKRMAKRGDAWFEKNINSIIFFSRFLIQLRFIGPFLAGQKKVSMKTFMSYDLLALVVYVPLYTILGLYFHNRVKLIIEDIGVARNIVLIVVGILLAYGVFRFIKKILFRESTQTLPPLS